MLFVTVTVVVLLALFYLLGEAADLVIRNLRAIGEKMGVSLFFLGLLMGIFTSFPEMAIGVNAIIDGVPNISLGNLFGGIMVLFGLILGASVFWQRNIESKQANWQFGLILLFLFFPVLLGLDGNLGLLDGLIMIIGYFALLFVLYRQQRSLVDVPRLTSRRNLIKHAFLSLLGMVLVLLIASLTIDFATGLLYKLPLSKFVIGIVIFAVGTNFPEITIAVRSWKHRVNELSISNLLGSGLSNILLIGIFSATRPFKINIDASYYLLIVGLAMLLSLLFIFYRSGRALKRAEGLVLVAIYLTFIASQIILETSPLFNGV
jgi:cation:H+ antiporter